MGAGLIALTVTQEVMIAVAGAAGAAGGGTGMNNNCCSKGMQQPTPPIANVIQGTMDTYAIVTNKFVIAHDAAAAALHSWYETGYNTFTSNASSAWSYVTGPIKGVAEAAMNSLGLFGGGATATFSMAATNVGTYTAGLVASIGPTQASNIATDIASYAGTTATPASTSVLQYGLANSTTPGLLSQLESEIVSVLKSAVTWILEKVFQMLPSAAASTVASMSANIAAVTPYVSGLMSAYSAYQLAFMLASMLTQCKAEEFKLGFQRKEHLCHMVGTYCKDSLPVFGCQMTATTFCCYPSPLVNIIMSQIQDAQPQIAGGYGSSKNPNCGGLTIPELAQVNWSKVNLQPWLAMLQSSGLIQTTNSSAAAMNTPVQMAHPTGQVSPTAAVPTAAAAS